MIDARKYAPRRLKGDDIPDEGVDVQFTSVEEKTNVYKEGDQKLAIFSDVYPYYWLEPNKTQNDVLVSAFGYDATQWMGKRARLSKELIKSGQFAGEWTIIVEPLDGEAQPVEATKEGIPF